MRVAPPVVLDEQQRKILEQWARSRSLPIRQVQRAKIILLAADGRQDLEIAAAVNISNHKAARWRKRFLKNGFPGLEKDAPRPGRARTITASMIQDVVRKTTRETPDNATHWSTRIMAQAVGLSEKSVRRIWRQHGLKPHLARTFKVSNDPQFAEKLEAIIGLYLNPPEHAIVLCADEKSQIQALDRTQPGLPLKKGRCGTMTRRSPQPRSTAMMARSRRPIVVVMSGAFRRACACFSDSQFPVRTPIDFALFTRAMPAANSGASSPLSAASAASFRTAVIRTLMETDPRPRVSRATRQALTVALVKPGRGSWPYQAMNSSNPKL